MGFFSWLKEALRDKRLDPPPPAPAGWNKTLEDLDAEKRSLSGHEIHWAREYERGRLRDWARFPKDQEVFEAVKEATVSYVIHFRAPYGGGGNGTLPAATRVRVSAHARDPEPIGVAALPLDRDRVESLLVPEEERMASNYDGYELFIKVAQLNTEFRRIEHP